jgi:hypothetical protein
MPNQPITGYLFEIVHGSNAWQDVAHIKDDTIALNTTLLSNLSKPTGILDNPYFWNIASVVIGGIITIFCNIITQFILDKRKLKKDRTVYAIDLAWSIMHGVERARSINKSGFSIHKHDPARYIRIEPGIGAAPRLGSFDITKVGFLGTIVNNELPSKAQEYIGMHALFNAIIDKRNELMLREVQPVLDKISTFDGTSIIFDYSALEAQVGKISLIKLKTLTDEVYDIIEYLEANAAILIPQINEGLAAINSRRWIFLKNNNPPRIGIKPNA